MRSFRINLHALFRYYDEYPQYFHLEVLGTSPDHRRQGGASALVKWAVSKASQNHVLVGTEPGTSAVAFYQKLGFSTVGHLKLADPLQQIKDIDIVIAKYTGSGVVEVWKLDQEGL